MRALSAIVLAVCSTWFFSQPALAEKRVALVMGNSAYRNVVRLANPANDSEAMSAIFRKAGFDVVELKRNLGVSEMRRTLRDCMANSPLMDAPGFARDVEEAYRSIWREWCESGS